MTLNEVLAEVEQLDREATKGPWSTYNEGATVAVDVGEKPTGRRPCIINWPGFDSNDIPATQDVKNARLIARSRTLLPLLAKILQQALSSGPYGGHNDAIREIAERVLAEEEIKP